MGDGGANSPTSVGDTLACPSSSVDVLGVSFDNRLTPAPHLASMLRSACVLAGAIRHLSIHLRLPVLKQVIRALLVGKVGYACAVLKPRLLATDPVQKDLAEIQTAVNDCSRAIIGSKRSNRMPILTLLAKVGIPSVNQLIVEQLAIETWKAMNYKNDGVKTPIGQILCPTYTTRQRQTCASSTNCISPLNKFRSDTFAWFAFRLWNDLPPLRSAPTLPATRKAAKKIAQAVPF